MIIKLQNDIAVNHQAKLNKYIFMKEYYNLKIKLNKEQTEQILISDLLDDNYIGKFEDESANEKAKVSLCKLVEEKIKIDKHYAPGELNKSIADTLGNELLHYDLLHKPYIRVGIINLLIERPELAKDIEDRTKKRIIDYFKLSLLSYSGLNNIFAHMYYSSEEKNASRYFEAILSYAFNPDESGLVIIDKEQYDVSKDKKTSAFSIPIIAHRIIESIEIDKNIGKERRIDPAKLEIHLGIKRKALDFIFRNYEKDIRPYVVKERGCSIA